MDSTSSKRIILIRNAFSYDFGGAERYPIYLASELKKNGYEPIIASAFGKIREVADNKKIATLHGWWWPMQNWSGLRALLFPVYLLWQIILSFWYLQLLLRLNPRIVHPMSKDDFIAATFAGRLLGKKVIWTDHADLKYVFTNHKLWYKNPVGKLVYLASRMAHTITISSHSEYKLIGKALGHKLDNRYLIIHNGISEISVKPHPRSDNEKSSFIFCATSRLVEAKGIAELIAAFAKAHQSLPNIRLWLVGDGPDAKSLKAQAEGIEGITFIGYSDEALSYLLAADVFVHPSYHEAFSLSLIEATMLGKPVIACDVGGNPEIIQDGKNGILVPAKNVERLSEAMQQLAENKPLSDKMGEYGRLIYEKSFRFENIVKDKFIPLYEKV